ncbi:MAG: radical SAM protein [Candidatus Omnitrophota bacterium]
MLHKLLGMNTELRQQCYEVFCSLPEGIKNILINVIVNIYKLQARAFPTPPRLIWYITSRCNARCSHCFYTRYLNRTDDLTIEDVKKIVKSLKVRLEVAALTGGEPFLHPDLFEFCKTLVEINRTKLISLSTNGSMPDSIEQVIKKILKNMQVKINIQVSLDGMRELHDKVRGVPGIFDYAVETVLRLKKIKLQNKQLNDISVMTTLSQKNEKHLPELILFVREKLKVFHKFQFIRAANTDVFQAKENWQSGLISFTDKKPENISSITDFLSEQILKHNNTLLARKQVEILRKQAQILEGQKPWLDCFAGCVDGVIFANGDVAVCELSQPLANLRDFNFNFYELWQSPQANEMRRNLTKCFCIHPCNLMSSISFTPSILKRLSAKYYVDSFKGDHVYF